MIPSARTCNGLLVAILFFQWIALTVILQRAHTTNTESIPTTVALEKPTQRNTLTSDMLAIETTDTTVEGVFATVLFRAPRWMHLRYTHMVSNAIMNLPSNKWRVQLFLNRPWVNQELLPWHPGLIRLLQDPRVIVTDIPDELLVKGSKPKHVLSSSWLWHAMAGDAVVLFSGNGAFCGNHHGSTWNHFVRHVDFCGTPARGGMQDVSTHSFRNRLVMVDAMAYAAQHQMTPTGTEGAFIRDVLERMQTNGTVIRMGNTKDMELLGGVTNLTMTNGTLQRIPLLVSGTHAAMAWHERDSLLKHCPELKMIFPSMHEPACFGAHPNPAVCQQSICALQDVVPKQGC